jgi:hypothetical protein
VTGVLEEHKELFLRGGRKYYSSQRSQRNYYQKEKQGRKGKDT